MRLHSRQEREERLKEILQFNFADFSELIIQKKVLFSHNKFKVLVNVSSNAETIYITFEAPRSWWMPVAMQAKSLIDALVKICSDEIPGIMFEKFVVNHHLHGIFPVTHLVEIRNADRKIIASDPFTAGTVIAYFEANRTCRVEIEFKCSCYYLDEKLKSIRPREWA